MPELLLASTSPARRALMDALGIPYRSVAPEVDESLPPGICAEDAVRLLARKKAHAVRARHPEALVLAADQLAAKAGQVLGKPPDKDAAREQLALLAGSTHAIVTGVCLLGPGQVERCEVEVAHLTFHPLSPEELERYLELEEWRGCAGGYRIEAQGQGLLAKLEGDRTNVQGLPMMRVVHLLREAHVPFFHRPSSPHG